MTSMPPVSPSAVPSNLPSSASPAASSTASSAQRTLEMAIAERCVRLPVSIGSSGLARELSGISAELNFRDVPAMPPKPKKSQARRRQRRKRS